MAEEFKVKIGVELQNNEFETLRNQINQFTQNTHNVNLTVNTRNVQNQIDNIRNQIEQLSNIRINLGGNGANRPRAVNEITQAYRDLMNLQRQINSTRVKISGLDATKDTRQIQELSGQLNRLMTDYNNLYQTFNRHFSIDQIDNLNRAFDIASNKIAAVNAHLSDTSGIKSQEQAYRELYSISKQINSLELKIGALNGSGHTQEINELNNQLNILRNTYNQVRQSFQGNLSTEQLTKLNTIIYETQDKLNVLRTKLLDTINTGLDSGGFQTSISNIQTGLNGLSVVSTELQTDFQLLTTTYKNMQSAQASGNEERLVSEYQIYDQVLKRITNSLKLATQEQQNLNNAQKLQNSKIALSNQMDIWLKNNSAAAKQFGAEIQKLKVELQSCDSVRFNGIKSEFQAITQQATLAGKATVTFGDHFKNQLSKYSYYLSGAMLITQSVRALRDMYNNVVDIDSAMTELKKVTDETNESYNNFLDNASNKSKEIGTTIKDYISSTADFARLGYDFKNSQNLAEVANIYNVVGDDVKDIETATKSIISTMTAFNVEADNSISIVDKLNEVGNKYAISSGGIGDALTRSASSMQAANNTLDETIGLITAANTVVQDPDIVGKVCADIKNGYIG